MPNAPQYLLYSVKIYKKIKFFTVSQCKVNSNLSIKWPVKNKILDVVGVKSNANYTLKLLVFEKNVNDHNEETKEATAKTLSCAVENCKKLTHLHLK